MDPPDIEAVWGLLCAVSDADGHPPLGEHRWLDLVQGGRQSVAGIVARMPGHAHGPVGYAQVSGGSGDWSVDLVVHPHHRDDPNGLAEALLSAALGEVARAGGGHVHLWVPKPKPSADTVAAAVGLAIGRDLLQLRRPLPLEDELREEVSSLETRAFVPGQDEVEWLRVNNRAFEWHPEQGGWTAQILASRTREPWFDPAGFLLHEERGRLAGFCWTKVHADHDPPLGEIYVIAVDPAYQGRKLGRLLTLAGLAHLEAKGLSVGMLYVDSTNTGAVSLYEKLGFRLDHVDRAYVGNIPAS